MSIDQPGPARRAYLGREACVPPATVTAGCRRALWSPSRLRAAVVSCRHGRARPVLRRGDRRDRRAAAAHPLRPCRQGGAGRAGPSRHRRGGALGPHRVGHRGRGPDPRAGAPARGRRRPRPLLAPGHRPEPPGGQRHLRPCRPPRLRPPPATAASKVAVIPATRARAAADLRERAGRYFLPSHRAVPRGIAAFRRAGRDPAIISVHSFTPRMNGEDRPWQVGVLWRHDRRIADPVLDHLRARGDLVVGDNQPYSGLGEFGFTVEFHAQRTRLPHVMFEVRQDEIDTPEKAERWADILADALAEPLARPDLYTRFNDVPETPGLEGFSWRRGSRL